MGKGFNNYMCKKFFHPASKDNLKRVWMAQQKHEYEKKKQEDLQNQYQKEQEMYAHRALLGDTKAKLGLSFMYDAPAGAKNSREKEDGEPEYKFEWQGKYKAPREVYNKNDDSVQDQPFGIEVRNVRCIKCHKWGHMNTDKICPLFKESLTAEPPQPKDNSDDLLRDLQEDGLKLKQVVMGRKNNPKARNQQMIDSDDDDPESQFLNSLSDKQKKKLLKKIEKLQRKKKKKRSQSEDSQSDDSEGSQRRKGDSAAATKTHRKFGHSVISGHSSSSRRFHHPDQNIRSNTRQHSRSLSPDRNGRSNKRQHSRSPSPDRNERSNKRRHSPSPSPDQNGRSNKRRHSPNPSDRNGRSSKRHHSPSPSPDREKERKTRRSASPSEGYSHRHHKSDDSHNERESRRKKKNDLSPKRSQRKPSVERHDRKHERVGKSNWQYSHQSGKYSP